jgi:hypothetical protein
MTRLVIAVDPGKIGGLAWSYKGGVYACGMPDTLTDIRDKLEEITGMCPTADAVIYMEDVGTYMPGNSGPSAATFAEHVGALKGMICCLRVRLEMLRPAKWMHAFIGKPSYPPLPKYPVLENKKKKTPEYKEVEKERKRILARRKTERKNTIKAKAQCEFPDTNITLKTSDALGMLWYGHREEEGRLF